MARQDLHRGEDLDRHPPRAPLVRALAIAFGLLAAAPLAAASSRWHVVLPGEPPVEYSLLFSRDPGGDVTRLLLSTSGARLELLSRQDPEGRDSTESVADAETKERLERRLLLSGYEGVPACAGVRPPDACLVFTGASGSVATSLAAFSGEGAASLRARLAALVTPPFDAKLCTLAAVFARSAEFLAYGDDFLRLAWPGRFPRGTGTYLKGARSPGCDFDASFGHPCSGEERRRDRPHPK